MIVLCYRSEDFECSPVLVKLKYIALRQINFNLLLVCYSCRVGWKCINIMDVFKYVFC